MSTLSQEANDVLRLAKAAAAEFGLGYVGTEHLLLGLVREGKGLAAETLRQHGVHEYNVLAAVQEQLKGSFNQTWVMGRLPGTPHFCDVLTHAKAESRGSGNWQIASEHLLLGLLKTQKSTGYRVLCALGITPERVRKAIADRRLPSATSPLPAAGQKETVGKVTGPSGVSPAPARRMAAPQKFAGTGQVCFPTSRDRKGAVDAK